MYLLHEAVEEAGYSLGFDAIGVCGGDTRFVRVRVGELDVEATAGITAA